MGETRFRRPVGRRLVLAAFLAFGLYVAWIAAWSRQGDSIKPVRLGIDRCYHCGMIVSDLRFSVSVLDQDEQGHRVTRHFDDPGCFEEFAKGHPKAHFTGLAHDYRNGQEIPLNRAQFQKTGVDTPMGSGVVASQAGTE